MPKILIVDDSQTARMIMRRCIEMSGLQGPIFIEASDGETALATAKNELPDLIVADLNMPKIDGEALLNSLKTTGITQNIPVIIASSAVNTVRNQRLSELGVLGFVNKPVTVGAVKVILDKWMGN